MKSSEFKILLTLNLATLFLIALLYIKISTHQLSQTSNIAHDVVSEVTSIPVPEYSKEDIIGDTNASNELIVISQYSCIYCQDFYNDVFDSLMLKHIYDGDLKIIYYHLLNPSSIVGSLMAQVEFIAKNEGHYLNLLDIFYNNEVPKDSLSVIEAAIKAGLNKSLLKSNLNDPKLIEKAHTNYRLLTNIPNLSTPTFILNGQVIKGFQPYDVFDKIIF